MKSLDKMHKYAEGLNPRVSKTSNNETYMWKSKINIYQRTRSKWIIK